MKRIFLPLLLLFVLISGLKFSTNAQTLYFCKGVDASWYPIQDTNVFTLEEDSVVVIFLVRSPYFLGCTYVNYKFYVIDENGKEQYYATILQENMGKNWQKFLKGVLFNSVGTYHIYVYDCDDKVLTDSKITIKSKD